MASTTELRKTYTDAAKNLTGSKPFYAFVGSGDLAVEKLKDVPAKLREELRGEDGAVKKVTDKISELPRDPRKLGAKLSDLADEQLKAADKRIDKLADRGEKVVKKVRNRGKDETPTPVVTPAPRRAPRAAAAGNAKTES